MADLLNAIFYSFWTFAGTFLLLALVVKGVVVIAAAVVALSTRRDAQ